jgi:hypothetical protein
LKCATSGETVNKTISRLAKIKTDLEKNIVPYARAGSNQKAAKAVKKIFEGIRELADIFIDDYQKHEEKTLVVFSEQKEAEKNGK